MANCRTHDAYVMPARAASSHANAGTTPGSREPMYELTVTVSGSPRPGSQHKDPGDGSATTPMAVTWDATVGQAVQVPWKIFENTPVSSSRPLQVSVPT